MSALRRERVNRGLDIGELASLSGVNSETIGQIERGDVKTPRAATLMKLAQALSKRGGLVMPSDIDPMAAAAPVDGPAEDAAA